MSGDLWIAGVIVMQSLASACYLCDGDWKQSIVWGGVAASNMAYLMLTRS